MSRGAASSPSITLNPTLSVSGPQQGGSGAGKPQREVAFAAFAVLESILLRCNCSAGAVLLAEDAALNDGTLHRGGDRAASRAASRAVSAQRSDAPMTPGTAGGPTPRTAEAHKLRTPSQGLTRQRSVAVIAPAEDFVSTPAPTETLSPSRHGGHRGPRVTNRSTPASGATSPEQTPFFIDTHGGGGRDGGQSEQRHGELELDSAAARHSPSDAPILGSNPTPGSAKLLSPRTAGAEDAASHHRDFSTIRFRAIARVGHSTSRAYGDLAMQIGAWSTGIAVNCNANESPFLCVPIASLHRSMSHLAAGVPGATRGHATRENFPYTGLIILTDRNAAPGYFTAQDEANVECLSATLGNLMSRYPAASLIDQPYVPGPHFNLGPELPGDWQLPDYIVSSLAKIGHGPRRQVLRTSTAATFPRRNITQSTFDVPGLAELSCVARHIETVADQLEQMRARLMQLETAEQASQRRQQALNRDLVEAKQIAARQTEVAAQHDQATRLLREELVARAVGSHTRRGSGVPVPTGAGAKTDASLAPVDDEWVPNVSAQMDAQAAAELRRIRDKVARLDALSKSRADKWRQAHPDAAAEFDLQRMSGQIDASGAPVAGSPRQRGPTSGKLGMTASQEALLRHPPPKPPAYIGLPGQSRAPRVGSAAARPTSSKPPEATDARIATRELRSQIAKAKAASAARQRVRERLQESE